MNDTKHIIRKMMDNETMLEDIEKEAKLLGPGVLELLYKSGIKIKVVPFGERLKEYTKEKKSQGVIIEPGTAGIYIPHEKTLFLLMEARGTIVHELAHALDDVLGLGNAAKENEIPYRTSIDKNFREKMYGNKISPTPYGTTNAQEFFAECIRAYCEADNTGSIFAPTGPEHLKAHNRETTLFITNLMIKLNGRTFEAKRSYRTKYLPSFQNI